MKPAIESQDEFEQWLFDMDDVLDEFRAEFSTLQGVTLDFTPESLDKLERWLLSEYPNVKAALKLSEKFTVDKAARYVGETFRKRIGGQWSINLVNPKYVFYGLPELRSKSTKCTPECPHTLVTASLDRRTGVFIRTVLSNSAPF